MAAAAATLGTPRYAIQASLVAAMAAHRMGLPPDHDEVGRLLLTLDQVAGLESWWITVEVAREFQMPQWDDLARRRVADLCSKSGTYAPSLERFATRRLDWH